MKKSILLALLTVFFYNATTAQLLETLKDINTNGSSSPRDLTLYNNKLYFTAVDDTHGAEMWVTEGTTASTKIAFDYTPGTASTNINSLVAINNKLFFKIYGNDYALLSTDGTLAGTVVISNQSSFSKPVKYNNAAYFLEAVSTNSYKALILKKTDGTVSGTVSVDTLFNNYTVAPYVNDIELIVFNNKLYFSVKTDFKVDEELMVYDPIANDAIYADLSADYVVNAKKLYPYQNNLYFIAELNSKTIGQEMFSLNTNNTVNLVNNFTPGLNSTLISEFYGFGNSVFFKEIHPTYGYQLFSFSVNTGSVTGYPVLNNNLGDGSIYNNFTYKGNMYFSALSDSSHSLYRFNANTNTIELIKNIRKFTTDPYLGYPSTFFEYNDLLYFYASDTAVSIVPPAVESNMQLWQSDGTTAGTKKVNIGSIPSFQALNDDNEAIQYNGSMYLAGKFNNLGSELQKFTIYPAAVNDVKSNLKIEFYPNPVTSQLIIDNHEAEAHQLIVRSITGEIILKQAISRGKNTINLEGASVGLYLLQVTDANNQILNTYKINKN
jgi:ELWxxDGT repeat protein